MSKNTHVYLGPDIPDPTPPPPVIKNGDRVDPKALPEPLASMVKANPDLQRLMVRPAQVDETRVDLQIRDSKAATAYRTAAELVRRNG